MGWARPDPGRVWGAGFTIFGMRLSDSEILGVWGLGFGV